jgi:prepilin-type N-terminal cleavage/methylation domain-containing protein
MPRRASGYTLLELLVCIAIIWLMASVLYPMVASARGKAYQTRCVSNLKQIGTAMDMYYEDWGYYPPDLDLLRDTEGVSDEVLVCRADSTDGARGPKEIARGWTRPLSYWITVPSAGFGSWESGAWWETRVFYGMWLLNNPLAGPLAVCRHHNPPGTGPKKQRVLGVYADGHVDWCKLYIKEVGPYGMVAYWPFYLEEFEPPTN